MPRYVILRHDPPPGSSRALHWDLMLEFGETLRTWALAAEPRPGASIPASPLADHRKAYLDYEGPLSGNRGSVARWDGGTYRQLDANDRRVLIVLEGERLRGAAEIVSHADDPRSWTVTFSGE